MSLFEPNNSGTVAFTNGSTAIAGVGTLLCNYRAGSVLSIPGIGEMQLADDPGSDTAGAGVIAWQGPDTGPQPFQYIPRNEQAVLSQTLTTLLGELASGNLQALAALQGRAAVLPIFTGAGVLDLIAKSDLVAGVSVDAHVADMPGLAVHDGKPGPTAERDGFTVRVADDGFGRAVIVSKNSDDWADWSDPASISGPAITLDVTEVDEVPYGALPDVTLTPRPGGYDLAFDIPRGMIIEPGATTTLAADQPAAVTFVPIVGGYRLDISIPRGAAGTGDIVGPAGAVADRIAVFNGITGKLQKDGGKTIAELEPARVKATKAIAEAGTDTDVRGWAAEQIAQAIFALAPSSELGTSKVVTDYTVTLADSGTLLHVDDTTANRTITLPVATTMPEGFTITFKKSTGTTYSTSFAGALIDGVSNRKLVLPNQSLTIIKAGSSWLIVTQAVIVESGSNANGSYVRFADGLQICTKRLTGVGPATVSSGALFFTSVVTGGNYAAAFVATPEIATGSWCAGAVVGTFVFNVGVPTAAAFGSYALGLQVSNARTDFVISLTATGRWL